MRDGIILNMPFMLIGSFFLIFAYLPIPGYADMMSSLFGEVWRDKMLYPVKATYDIMALISSFGIAYRLAEKYRTLDPLERWSDVAGGLHDDDPAEHAVYAGTRRGGGD
ncbi:putative phosphotransferase protein [Klebsiella pneumoniae]|uniref:Putative phosphotransferase protein n=1 Tax=Klebsiella pneumoniae TaxID=573 RepID=A0A2X3ETI1_KLEPN|nr:putative phosphotransferase protein [Klebsiella pneumoniae]